MQIIDTNTEGRITGNKIIELRGKVFGFITQ